MSTTPSPNPFRDHWAESLRLRREASEGSLDAMRALAERQDPVYRDAFREACRDVLGEDPDDLYYGDLGPPDCNRAAVSTHRHTAHCWGMDDPIRGEL